MLRPVSLWAPVVLYMAAIFYVSSLPDVRLPAGIPDLPTHGGAYLVLGVLVMRALAGGLPARIRWSTALAAVAVSVAYGATDEFHQSFVPGRTAELRDLYSDALGSALGAAVCWAWGIISPRPELSRRASRHDL